MDYFNDKYLHPIDSKGRLLLPKDIRDHFEIRKSESLYLIPSSNETPCLEIRTQALWDQFNETLLEQTSGPQKKRLVRFVSTQHARIVPDGQGRIVIPEKLRSVCELEDTVAVVNMAKYIEVWCKKHIDAEYPEMMKAYRELSDNLF